MINTTKTVGTKETFNPERIHDLLSQAVITNITNLEKAIFCLEYVGQLQEEGLDLIFKGGSALQVLLGSKWTRLSIDIDICTGSPKEELETILEKIHNKFDKKAFSYIQRNREISNHIPFYLYRIETPAITEKSRTILLDAIGIKPKIATQQTSLKTFFYESSTKITTPTTGALLGDKLTTIGPTTVGRPLKDSRNGLEYAKHLFDIGILQETDFHIQQCKAAYAEVIRIQSKIRNKEYTRDECFEDMLFTCQVASLPQQLGEQTIKELPSSHFSRAASEFRILQDGLRRFRPFLVQKISYTWDDLRYNAARTALLIKILNSNIADAKATTILNFSPPAKKKEILALIEQINKIPKEERWFIIPNEIVNFPKILRVWHSFFFLSELV
ncbi:MAG: nucleotidyl transferase AbiEii/AbiGii toxin family protein [Candidatus Bathyarchaeota archaeon]|nr:nucleotidyl transferase AbiEii/AbiGii toxin family protein [Candidatus Bathyarchaeota archaeon]